MRRAVSFLTPFGGAADPAPSALAWFPAVGAIIGLVVGGIWWAARRAWAPPAAAAIAVIADAALTGMLHLDGFADAADGLLPPLPRARRLEVMADPRLGGPGHRAARPFRRVRIHAAQPARGGRALVRIPDGNGGHGPCGPLCAPGRPGERVPHRARPRPCPAAGGVRPGRAGRPGGPGRSRAGRCAARHGPGLRRPRRPRLGRGGRRGGGRGRRRAPGVATARRLHRRRAGRGRGCRRDRRPAHPGVAMLTSSPPGKGEDSGRDLRSRCRFAVHSRALVRKKMTAPWVTWPAAAALGLLLDRALGEPPAALHPVAWFGRAMLLAERAGYRDSRAAGARHAALGVLAGVGAGACLNSAVLGTWLAAAGRCLGESALTVARALDRGDLPAARAALPALVGRDPAGLDEGELARAVVESVAENTVDALVAPAFWAAICGAPGAFGYRAVNTLDAMVGHRSTRYHAYGWASARLDDVAGYLPARLTAALVAGVRPRRAAAVWRAVRGQAPAHPSPNAGVAEAAFAAALGLRLGGCNRYGDRVERRPWLGQGHPAAGPDIEAAVRLSSDVSWLLTAILAAAGLAGTPVRRLAGDARRGRAGAAGPARPDEAVRCGRRHRYE